MIEKLTSSKDSTLVFMGASNSGKTNIMESCFTEVSKQSPSSSSPILSSRATLAAIQSLATLQQGHRADTNRSTSVISCLFDSNGSFMAAYYSLLGLELSRVSKLCESDSDYFVFHDLFEYASKSMKETLFLNKLKIDLQKSMDSHDSERYHSFLECFHNFDLSTETDSVDNLQISFFKVIATILHLRELDISEDESGNVIIGDVEHIAELLGLPIKTIQNTLGVRRVNAGRRTSTCETFNTVEQTKKIRDVLIKQLYRSNVMWFLKQLNRKAEIIEKTNTIHSALHLIDVPSPENNMNDNNDINQLCRNFFAETVYNAMIHTLFESEKNLMNSQGLGALWTPVEVEYNTQFLNIFTQNGRGLLPLLDAQTQLGDAASDKAYLSGII
jgi:myosin heavy subunit